MDRTAQLTASITEIASEDYGRPNDGWCHRLYLDPSAGRLYTYSDPSGSSRPMAADAGPHLHLCRVPSGTVATSLAAVLTERLDSLAALCSNDESRDAQAWAEIDEIPGRVVQWWPADEWYRDVSDELPGLAARGLTAEEIVEHWGTGDDDIGRVHHDDAVAWVQSQLDDLEAEAAS